MNAAWIVLGVAGLAVVLLMLMRAWHRRDHERDLGSVSQQWVAEQRMGQGHDSQR